MLHLKCILIITLLTITPSSFSFDSNNYIFGVNKKEHISSFNDSFASQQKPCEINSCLVGSNNDDVIIIARRGCCSHHGGVCGCRGGRQLCCDGSLSPSCGC